MGRVRRRRWNEEEGQVVGRGRNEQVRGEEERMGMGWGWDERRGRRGEVVMAGNAAVEWGTLVLACRAAGQSEGAHHCAQSEFNTSH